jgi:hypothetical protein
MPRGRNWKTYRYHIHGTIGDVEINCKCTSFNEFLDKFGGDKTPLGLHRRKLHRLRTGYYAEGGNIANLWKTIQIDNINEKVKYVRADEIPDVKLNFAPEEVVVNDNIDEVILDVNGDVIHD